MRAKTITPARAKIRFIKVPPWYQSDIHSLRFLTPALVQKRHNKQQFAERPPRRGLQIFVAPRSVLGRPLDKRSPVRPVISRGGVPYCRAPAHRARGVDAAAAPRP